MKKLEEEASEEELGFADENEQEMEDEEGEQEM